MKLIPKKALLILISVLGLNLLPGVCRAQQAAPQGSAAAQQKSDADAKAALAIAKQGEADDPNLRGSITGRVMSEDGPLPFAQLSVTPVSGPGGPGRGRFANTFRSTTSDEQGNFKVDGLGATAWNIFVSVPGYVMEPVSDSGNRAFYRIGDSAAVRMQKGGVITGRVLSSGGEPVVAVQVSVQMVRDAAGNPSTAGGAGGGFQTDDRGVFRVYGLQAGNYVVSAGRTGAQGPGGGRFNPYDGDVPTFYPSATRDTAIEVTVNAGSETSGIDIQYRGGKGKAISGKVTGAIEGQRGGRGGFGFGGPGGPGGAGIMVQLNSASTGQPVSRTFVQGRDGINTYVLYGVPDGEYELVAERNSAGDNDAVSSPRKVQVLGRDVTGVDLVLIPTASVSGGLRRATETKELACKSSHVPAFSEQVLELVNENSAEDAQANRRGIGGNRRQVPERNGSISFQSLSAGRYRVVPRLLDDNWFLKSITLPGAPVKTTAKAAPKPAVLDVGRNGLTLKAGDRLSGLMVTVGDGAASLSGKLVPAPNTSLAPNLKVVLVPAEKERQEDYLRYSFITAGNDGAFKLRNLAPGKYLVLPSAEGEELSKKLLIPSERIKLVKEAETLAITVELQPCQKLEGQTVKLPK